MSPDNFTAHYWNIYYKVREKAFEKGISEEAVDNVADWALKHAPELWAEAQALDEETDRAFGRDFENYKKKVVTLGKALLRIFDRMAAAKDAAGKLIPDTPAPDAAPPRPAAQRPAEQRRLI